MAKQVKYVPTERIGAGPACDVYLGADVGGLQRTVIIKRLREESRTNTPIREAFFAAAERWSALKHPGLVTLYDLDRPEAAVIYEPHAHSAAQLLGRTEWGPEGLEGTLRQTLGSLAHMHQRGLLHLNVKPTNLLFDSQLHPKLVDGRCVDRERPGELQAPRGAQKYLAPEMIDPSLGPLGPTTDVYCLGFVFLELLIGKNFDDLFRGVGVDAIDPERNWLRWHAAADEPLPSIAAQAPGINPALERVLGRMLQKRPSQRYRSADEVLRDLQELFTGPKRPSEAAESAPLEVQKPRVTPRRLEGQDAPRPEDIPDRPAAPVVLRFLGDSRDMHGVNKDVFTIGEHEDCDVRWNFGAAAGVESPVLRFGRGAEGWRVNSLTGGAFYVNQEHVSPSSALRSGDVIRCRPGGAGVQFTILNQNVEPLTKLAARFAPRLLQQPTEAKQPPSPAAPVKRDAAKPSAPPVPETSPSRDAAAPSAPRQPAPSGGAPRANAANAPAPPSRAVAPESPAAQAASSPGKRMRDLLAVVVALLVLGLLISQWPSETAEPPAIPEAPATEPQAGDSTTKAPAAGEPVVSDQPATPDPAPSQAKEAEPLATEAELPAKVETEPSTAEEAVPSPETAEPAVEDVYPAETFGEPTEAESNAAP